MINRHFTALKGIAIVLVVLSHSVSLLLDSFQKYGHAQPPIYILYILIALREVGLVAVPTFLFLSGCYVVYAIQGKNWVTAYKSIGASVQRVLWPYLIWSAAFYLAAFVLEGAQSSLQQYGKDLVVGYPYNFVPLLVACYLVSPLLVNWGQRRPGLLLAAIAVYQVFLINVYAPGALGLVFPGWARYLSPPILRDTMSFWAIQFPLGVVYALHAKVHVQRLRQMWPLLAALGLAFYGLRVLRIMHGQDASLAGALCPVPLMLIFGSLRREFIPWVKGLEHFGRWSYGLYLTNLIVLSLLLALFNSLTPWAFRAPLLLVVVLFLMTLMPPAWIMGSLDRLPIRKIQRYVFG